MRAQQARSGSIHKHFQDSLFSDTKKFSHYNLASQGQPGIILERSLEQNFKTLIGAKFVLS